MTKNVHEKHYTKIGMARWLRGKKTSTLNVQMKYLLPLLSIFVIPSKAITLFITSKIFFAEDFMQYYDKVCGDDGRPFIATKNTLDFIYEVMYDGRVDSAWVGGWYVPLDEPHRANLGKNTVTINPDDRPEDRFPVICEDLTDDEHDQRASKKRSKSKKSKSSRNAKEKTKSKKKDYYCDKKGKKCKTYFDI